MDANDKSTFVRVGDHLLDVYRVDCEIMPITLPEAQKMLRQIYPSSGIEEILNVFSAEPSYAFSGSLEISDRRKYAEFSGHIGAVDKAYRGHNIFRDYDVCVCFHQDYILINSLNAVDLRKRLGSGGKFFEKLEEFAVKAGVAELNVMAASYEGGYFWAARGFVPETEVDWENLKQSVCNKLDKAVKEFKLTHNVADSFRGKVDKLDGDNLRDFACRRDILVPDKINSLHWVHKEKEVPIGAYLLRGSCWNGRKTLDLCR